MTIKDKRDYWIVFNSFQKSREKKYAPMIQRALLAQKADFINQYKAGQITVLNSAPMVEVIHSLYLDAAIVFGAKVLASLKQEKARMPMGFNYRMQQLIESYFGIDFLNLSTGISDTTKDILMNVLIDAQAQGLGFDEIIRQLEKTELSKARAAMIARTETVSSANHGAMLGATESGLLVKKVWIATMDNRTRHDHSRVSTEAIGYNEPFNVGGYDMQQPGDKGGKNGALRVPAKEIVNCRCAVAFEPQRDANGRLIRS